jgi:prephenate dehydratase
MIVAFQGVKGAYSEDAVFSWDAGATTLECPDSWTIYDAVRSGRADLGMLPVENSIEGSVTSANDLLSAATEGGGRGHGAYPPLPDRASGR